MASRRKPIGAQPRSEIVLTGSTARQPVYQSNNKHSDPRQIGQRGTLCPRSINLAKAQEMLNGSYFFGGNRYAVLDGMLFIARQHRPGFWHGHPVGWVEVPPNVRHHFMSNKLVKNSDVRRNWASLRPS